MSVACAIDTTIIYLGGELPHPSSGTSKFKTCVLYLDTALHRGKDFAVAPACHHAIHPHLRVDAVGFRLERHCSHLALLLMY
ncbi:MAG: hypothetical protein RIT04_519 [Candidatus Parcubacteria bacterium]